MGFGAPLGPTGAIPAVPNAIDTEAILKRLQGLLPTPQPIVAPTVQAAQVALPLGADTYSQLASSIYASQAEPIIRELGRQGGIADRSLAGNLANASLADSGTGVGQREDLLRETQGRQEAVSRDVSAAATAQAIQANLAVNQQNAQLEQQARLTNAGFDYESQVQNAANLLTGNKAVAEGYLNAVGIAGQQASAWTSAYMNRLSEAERNRIMKDEKLQQFHGEWLNYLLNKEKISEDARQADQQVALAKQELQQQGELQKAQQALEQQQITGTLEAQNRELDISALSQAANAFGGSYQGNNEIASIAAALSNLGGAPTNYLSQNTETGSVAGSAAAPIQPNQRRGLGF